MFHSSRRTGERPYACDEPGCEQVCVCGAWRVTIVCVGFVPNRVKHVLPQRFYSAGNLSHHRRRHRVAKAGANIVCPEPGCGQVCRAHAAGEALVCSRQSAVVFRRRLLGDYG
jgi:hypothetical protein